MTDDGDTTEADAGEATEATKREGHGSTPHRKERPEPEPPGKLTRGTLLGRYVLIDVLGEGGMGVVYSAYDPELDRKLAIKLLQAMPGGSDSGGQAWLLREAQAMARLSHPNVIAVHDVGTLPGDRVFVAMELVEGHTLRDWLEVKPRTWREILPVMRAAGTGLAAAHAAGLVHRDFKPDNVLVGDDGRVRVMDFGLARLRLDDDDELSHRTPSQEPRSPLSERLTALGAVVGTPAYMAPEIYDGKLADARSDQFAFGVALYEALYRTRPFRKRELAPPRNGVPKPKPVPSDAGVPARIERVVMRAISIDPAARFATIDEMLAELAIDPTTARRRIALAAGALALAGIVVGGAVLMSHSRDRRCRGFDKKLAGAWDESAKAAVHAAFVATKHPRAESNFNEVSRILDAYATDWTQTSVSSCEATRIRGEQTEQDMSLREDCLSAHLEELRAFTQLLAKSDETMTFKASESAAKLDPIKQCSDLATLRAPERLPPEAKPKLDAMISKLANAKAAMLAGKLGSAINQANAAAEIAKTIPYDAGESDARLVVGLTMIQTGNMADALTSLGDAVTIGLRGHRDDIVAQAALYAAMVAAEGLDKDEVGRVWLDIGTALVMRVPNDRTLEVRRLEVEGIVKGRTGDMLAAAAAHERALVLAKEIYGPEALLIGHDEQLLAATLTKNEAYAKALPHFEHAIALIEKAEGPEHPDLAPVLTGYGVSLVHANQIEKARAIYDRALAIREKAFGKDNPMLIVTLNNTADLLRKTGDPQGALRYIQRALAIAERMPGKTHQVYHLAATTYGEILFALGRVDEARMELDEVLRLEDESHNNSTLGATLIARAQLEARAERWAEVEGFAERAVATLEAGGGKDAPSLWQPLYTLAQAKVATGKAAEAKPLVERALAIAQKAQVSESELGDVRALLGKL